MEALSMGQKTLGFKISEEISQITGRKIKEEQFIYRLIPRFVFITPLAILIEHMKDLAFTLLIQIKGFRDNQICP